ncbi:MAG: DUF3500 domain-containing protein [Nocardioides sp.]|uniref:DUF3500 domain-containing protein n=1 Tax=Nocardioides sp. TaxID=35761 RepID=UPI0039E6E6B9
MRLRDQRSSGVKPPMWTGWTAERAARTAAMNRKTAAEGLRGITTSTGLEAGLFPLAPTGLDVGPARRSAVAYLDGLSKREAAYGRFPIDDETWRQWMNGTRYFGRHGQCLEDLTDAKRDLALRVIESCLSEVGYAQLRDVMHLNTTLGEMRAELDVLNEWLYWFSIYGSPETPGAPWGWQLDGHHANVNCVVVGDQMTLTPSFIGAEPAFAEFGTYAGTRLLGTEERLGADLFERLDGRQQEAARIDSQMPEDLYARAYRDNLVLDYAGVAVGDMTDEQRELARGLIGLYVDRAPCDHARLRRHEIDKHLDQTHFAFVGDHRGPHGAFYYRIHSPVILIEFEHMAGVMFEVEAPWRQHIHTVVRTPNGNDYGADLLRQHHERHHPPRS